MLDFVMYTKPGAPWAKEDLQSTSNNSSETQVADLHPLTPTRITLGTNSSQSGAVSGSKSIITRTSGPKVKSGCSTCK